MKKRKLRKHELEMKRIKKLNQEIDDKDENENLI